MKARRREPPPVSDLQALLRRAGLRSTSPRVRVLEHLHAHDGPKSHGEIFEALGPEGLDRATVYRILVDLAEAKILTRSDRGDHVWRFELRGAGDSAHGEEHPHFVCMDCGEVSCLPGLSLTLQGGGHAPRAVVNNEVAVKLMGRCDHCA